MKTCPICAEPFDPPTPRRVYCSRPCKDRAKDLRNGVDCSVCGVRMVRGTGTRMDGTAVCRECRSARRHRPGHTKVCCDCGAACAGLRCLPCFNAFRSRDRDESRMARVARRRTVDNAAPGPWKYYRRRIILDRWRSQGRSCTYCGGAVETVDHVVPLTRGGTNFEGNLTPACMDCNALKRNHLLSVWRYKLRHAQAA